MALESFPYPSRRRDEVSPRAVRRALARVLDMVSEERARQERKWGDQSAYSSLLWLAILTEELGEVAKAMLERTSAESLRRELTQVAAVAVAAIEALEREPGMWVGQGGSKAREDGS
jgi:NTP pyrophosphatase (non-canonical NTP hydrolase)